MKKTLFILALCLTILCLPLVGGCSSKSTGSSAGSNASLQIKVEDLPKGESLVAAVRANNQDIVKKSLAASI